MGTAQEHRLQSSSRAAAADGFDLAVLWKTAVGISAAAG
jgi:hypothetical protein